MNSSAKRRSRKRILVIAVSGAVVIAGAAVAVYLATRVPEDPVSSPFKVTSNEGTGRWARTNPELAEDELTEEQKLMIAQLEAIGYLSGVEKAGSSSGAYLRDRNRTFEGPALYTSGHGPEAFLIDIEGNVLHSWSFPMRKAWPDYDLTETHRENEQHFFRRAHLFDNGDLLVIFEGYGIIKIDKDSKLIWAVKNRAHHAIDVQENGDLYILTRKAHIIPRLDESKPKLEDFIVGLHADGEEFFRLSLIEALEGTPWAKHITSPDPRLPPRFKRYIDNGDIFHTNMVEIVRQDHPSVPWLKQGNAIVSSAHLCAIFVVDLEQGKTVWFHKGDFTVQHEPTLLQSGNILFFDNHNHTKESRAVELDPRTMQVAWQYDGKPDHPFFSQCCSTAERLPNGNTQIVITDMGKVIEVTPEGEVVWEFFNPHRTGEQGELIASLFDMQRLPEDFPTGWARRPPPGS